MFRAIIWLIYFCLYLVYSLVFLIKVKWLERHNKTAQLDEFMNKKSTRWARSMVAITGSKIRVTGEENIPKEGGVLFVGNHQSYFDIMILLGYIKKPKAFIAKKELDKIPLLNIWIKYIGCILIDRKDIRQSLAAINQGAERLKQGYSMVIFPEGTRSEDGNVAEFKPGSLKMASKAKVPIIPITINGSINILAKKGFSIRPSIVDIIISPPVNVEVEKGSNSNQLSDTIRNTIIENLNKSKIRID